MDEYYNLKGACKYYRSRQANVLTEIYNLGEALEVLSKENAMGGDSGRELADICDVST